MGGDVASASGSRREARRVDAADLPQRPKRLQQLADAVELGPLNVLANSSADAGPVRDASAARTACACSGSALGQASFGDAAGFAAGLLASMASSPCTAAAAPPGF
jgi:hypothetical protein